MAISSIPGVGPQNSDIATAVAAPSAATIAAAVAAPSAATIASAVASSVPTLAQINTSVSTYASPFGGTWTDLGSYTSNTATAVFSNLSTYKYLRFFIYGGATSAANWYLRFNGDTGTNYHYSVLGSNASGNVEDTQATNNWINLAPTSATFLQGLIVTIFPTVSGPQKFIEWNGRSNGAANTPNTITGRGVWGSTAAVSSVTIGVSAGTFSGPRIIGVGAA